ncbi:MAG: preprotein translocase subunit YajC [Eubacteriales bacterium]|nr:preprotein translocase subunit YajC [Eubacteriales bacterium]
MTQIFLLQAPADAASSPLAILQVLAMPVLLLVVMYFLMIRPQKKQEKKQREMRAALKVGDKVVSIGGIVGRVVNIRDNEITIETSVAKTMMTFRKDAIQTVVKPISD